VQDLDGIYASRLDDRAAMINVLLSETTTENSPALPYHTLPATASPPAETETDYKDG
jgi:hypothetical protein